MNEILLRQAMARGYCTPENGNKELDAVLIDAMIKEINSIPIDALVSLPIDTEAEAFGIGFNFLEDVFNGYDKDDDVIGKLTRQIGYKRPRAIELLEHPERLRITEMVRICEKSGMKLTVKAT